MAITQTHPLELGSERLADDPLILIIPGLGNSGPDHWQTKWEAQIPDAERAGVDERIARFAPMPRRALPFPAFLAASENDQYCSLRTARSLAADWGATFAYAGSVGHINADSGIDDWAFGQLLLAQLLREHRTRQGIGRSEETATRRREAARYTRLPWIQSAEAAQRAWEW